MQEFEQKDILMKELQTVVSAMKRTWQVIRKGPSEDAIFMLRPRVQGGKLRDLPSRRIA